MPRNASQGNLREPAARLFASDEIEQAWLEEIDRRSAEIENGTAELVTWEQIDAQLEKMCEQARPPRR